MIVDNSGKIFENRRKSKSDRRKNEFDAEGGRRESIRRQNVQVERKNRKKK